MKQTLKTQLLALIDRRTTVAVLVVTLLFVLAWRGVGVTAAIDGMVFVACCLVGSNAAQGSLRAWAHSKRSNKPIKKEITE